MAGSLISSVLEQFYSILGQEAAHELSLITGVEKEVETLKSNLEALRAVLEDAEGRQVNDSAMKLWLSKLKDVAYDIDDVLDEWNTAILKRQIEQDFRTEVQEEHGPPPKKARFSVSNLIPSFLLPRQFVKRHETAVKIEELNKKLVDIANEKNRYNFTAERVTHHEQREITSSVFDELEVFVSKADKKTVKDMLLYDPSSSSQRTSATPRIISLVGMGGIGKTTLARLAFNDADVESHFEQRIWVCVSYPFDVERIALEILESLLDKKPKLVGRDKVLREISARVSGKKILLVLDDVWAEDSNHWEQLKGSLKNCSPGSRVLVTTRNKMVALKGMGSREVDMFALGRLPENKCWSLFCHLAFAERTLEECNNLEDIGRKIVKRCQGLPLAVKIIGGVLHFKAADQWQSILDSSKMWEIEEDFERGVFHPLLLSYYDLPPVLRQCFSYCAVFPKDYEIEKEKLIKLWMAQGFLEKTRNKGEKIVGEDYFNKLAMRSFFQDFRRDEENNVIHCKMHDIVHDFAQSLTKNECLLMELGDDWKEATPDFSLKTIRHSMLVVGRVGRFFVPTRIQRKLSPLLVKSYYQTNKENLLKETLPVLIGNWRKLRTLLIESDVNLLSSIDFDQLTCLRTLDLSLSYKSLEPKPGQLLLLNEIGKLIHLRYLNLSRNGLECLPPALCELCNLQTLDITGCASLKELPPGIGKLINLEHLENEGTKFYFMPKGMEKLTRLQTLREFHCASMETLKSKSCCLEVEGLGKLTHLQRSLTLNLRKSEAVPLSAMTDLRELTLSFERCEMQDEAFILQALQPPPNLATLSIQYSSLPTLFLHDWMMSLTKLKRVELYCSENLESLPPMGKLPYLEYLRLYELKIVTKVGEEFLGIERQDLRQASFSSSSIAFPKLKTLLFEHLPEWAEWEYGKLLSNITIMPLLSSLYILDCPKLKILPQHLVQNKLRGCNISILGNEDNI